MKKKLVVSMAVGAFIAPLMAQMDAGKTERGGHHSPAWIVALSGIQLMEQRKRVVFPG